VIRLDGFFLNAHRFVSASFMQDVDSEETEDFKMSVHSLFMKMNMKIWNTVVGRSIWVLKEDKFRMTICTIIAEWTFFSFHRNGLSDEKLNFFNDWQQVKCLIGIILAEWSN
jgi:hypothetical protein